VDINREELKTLSENPELTGKAIYERLGFKNDVTFYYTLNNTPGLRRIYDDGRTLAKAAKQAANGTGSKLSAVAPHDVAASVEQPRRKYSRRAGKKKTSSAGKKKTFTPPPAMGMPRHTRSFSESCSLNLRTSMFTAR
jgi:hypothetical protein